MHTAAKSRNTNKKNAGLSRESKEKKKSKWGGETEGESEGGDNIS